MLFASSICYDKLAKNKTGVEFSLVCQDLFDKTVDAEGMNTKAFKETVRAFLNSDYNKESNEKNFGLTKEQNVFENFEKFAVPKEYKITLQGVRLRMSLLNVHYDP